MNNIYEMEKLIELLNEWERERVNHNTKEYIKRGKNSFTSVGIIEIISKHYGFIKWLVENNKINREKADLGIIKFDWFDLCLGTDYKKQYKTMHWYKLLMLLAIQDEPIEFLISILK